jgi:YVTN family beta-propeller protein
MAMSADGKALYVANIPDGRLEIFDLKANGMSLSASVQVGLEPVAVAVHGSTVWVVNHLSDSISIVDVAASPPRVVRTLQVGDEPRDIVFAGPNKRWAFITTAHRGQNSPYPLGEHEVPGIGRADVWVFDTTNPGATGFGTRAAIINLFGDRPRALAVSPDGNTVYAAVYRSGNQTTAINETVVCNGGSNAGPCNLPGGGGSVPGGLPAPNTNADGINGPEVGLIVKFNPQRGVWEDELQRNWNNAVRFNLPDLDVFAIDATANPPAKIGGTLDGFAGVGTILFNMVTNPVSGKLYVSNTDAMNHIRFEGPGTFAAGRKPSDVPASVIGQLHKARITVIDGTSVLPRHLNKHIDYSVRPVPAGTKAHSLATPLEMAVTRDGKSLYVAAFGSARIGVLDTAQLESDTFNPTSASQRYINLTGGGPAGLVLDESRNRLYVLTRFDNTVSAVDLTSKREVRRVRLHNPEPQSVLAGRPFLYDANLSSSNGEASCSSCHMFGDMDDLGWDLGDPDGEVIANPNPFRDNRTGTPFHPMKGPMTTQSLRGMANAGPMHWRGDRSGGSTPGGDPLDEVAAFKAFSGAFAGLLGREEGAMTDAQMKVFADFILQAVYPPNPSRQLNNALRQGTDLNKNEELGRQAFFRVPGPDARGCEGCHDLNRAQGFFGTDGLSTFEGETQEFKIAHLRNMYQKIGMFGMPQNSLIDLGDNAHQGNQIRGFGIAHDGSIDTLFRFFSAVVFRDFDATLGPNSRDSAGNPDSALLRGSTGAQRRRAVETLMIVGDTGLAPIVGQQMTLGTEQPQSVLQRISLMLQRSGVAYQRPDIPNATECEVVVKGIVNGKPRGFLYDPQSDRYLSDMASEGPRTRDQMLAIAAVPGQELTQTCEPPGSGRRAGIDRDRDGVLDGDDICPDVFNPDQADSDSDGVGDACDNCIQVANGPLRSEAGPPQRDSDGDGYGNVCDADLDNNGLVNSVDLGLFKRVFGPPAPGDDDLRAAADFNADGQVNSLDLGTFKKLFSLPPGPSASNH